MIKHNFDKITMDMLERVENFSQPLKNFYGYLISRTELTFKKLGKRGSGPFREVSWDWFAPIRKKDGTLLDPVGRRIRHSGQRVHETSLILQDRGRMAAAALARYKVSGSELTAETPVIYANMQNEARPFAFVTDKDLNQLRRTIFKHVVPNAE